MKPSNFPGSGRVAPNGLIDATRAPARKNVQPQNPAPTCHLPPARERYVITLVPEPTKAGKEPIPPEIRLRQLLKIAFRGLGLRAVDVRSEQPDQPKPDEVLP